MRRSSSLSHGLFRPHQNGRESNVWEPLTLLIVYLRIYYTLGMLHFKIYSTHSYYRSFTRVKHVVSSQEQTCVRIYGLEQGVTSR